VIGEQFLTARTIRYDRATYSQRALWRWAMLGERCDLPDYQLDADELERLAGRVNDERWWEFRQRNGFTLYLPQVVRHD
jgi:hypothetical protein